MKICKLFLFLFISTSVWAQNTIGTVLLDDDRVLDGYSLFTPNKQSTTFLIDNCGRVINEWIDNPMAGIGADQYLLEDGSLLISKFDSNITTASSIGIGGAGGIIEIRSWDNELKWRYIIRDSLQIQHHDIHIMPNGNILALVLDRYFFNDIVAMGFDTTLYSQTELWPDKIVEIDTASNKIVWEWRAWDHLIQDVDPSKSNYGNISDNPNRININYQEFSFGRQDWMHSNSIDYNEELDQILFSVRNFQEIWIIDHSVTTEEAATSTGGNSGKGGDLLFRWGNDSAFDNGTKERRTFFYQHDASWLDESFHQDSEYYNMISVYNNFVNSEYSIGAILDVNYDNSEYEFVDSTYLPLDLYRTVSHPDTAKQRSAAASNFQLLPNGNFLIHAARQGRSMEITDDEIPVWEYVIPMRNGVSVEQGAILDISDNFTFSSRRYSADFIGFVDKDLTPKGIIELDPSDQFCNPLEITNTEINQIFTHPNPAHDYIILAEKFVGFPLQIYDANGTVRINVDKVISTLIDVSNLPKGIYFLKADISSGSFVKF